MDWTGPNASVAAGHALLERRIGDDIQDLTKHVYQLGQSLRSEDGTETGLTGFDVEFAVRPLEGLLCLFFLPHYALLSNLTTSLYSFP